MNIRLGHGVDVHPLKKNYPFILGGINIESEVGISGHSDGDILIHAIVDALLGALALGDIGTLFPSNKTWENCNSKKFLKETLKKINRKGYHIINIDTTVILQSPKINQYISQIQKSIAAVLNMDVNQISVKATTTDYLGFIGKNKGIAVFATALLEKDTI